MPTDIVVSCTVGMVIVMGLDFNLFGVPSNLTDRTTNVTEEDRSFSISFEDRLTYIL